ncbi:5-methyltetrahydropteroyltriglutamate--homocysteine S-methyltransferase [Campylobacter sp. RM9344]|uniref:5-methyltetrahydropteroyltriglutamate--homocysteine methyltransferase n=1 Tax=Campylobacter californiensis TaxID=1032243 RepID=A0AAW3ZWP8_9BACT|nr:MULTISPECIES: 5-methyltetrahydropteroyltriglutamate--homocysteine S-methyltransferase [unclassified Campylobacter]MBE2984988.1 5-methyltetrahydropteroyltriglutamate--homocysteine S-methyltransferase [Campylobacter sp. RM6883]MBE2995430.1 5-methyltetrahydropteroyltriglutamate--homocysteine S-methyltransferase [Campylobacter sp. RM6913]MBE3030185.1 5-methyltetrahydropteroyltriglutamate--homocysteine S-methyltransferase [Campylobacter sp. RM9344]MBE3608631.1 5-methyltetrahydropteroyltriglutamat
MIKSYVTGFPRIGEQRELKRALEGFWSKKEGFDNDRLQTTAKTLRARHWAYQKDAGIELISSNDFSFYDLMLDTIFALGVIPTRFAKFSGQELYFAMARGADTAVAMEMTKWFNTNYHYIVPELNKDSKFTLNADKIIAEYKEAKENGVKTKINLIGPITFLALSKTTDDSCAFCHLDTVVTKYSELLEQISKLDDEVIVQFDEPIFVTDKDEKLAPKIVPVYEKLTSVANNVKIVFMTYFEHALKAVNEVVKTKIYGLGLDFVYGERNIEALETIKNSNVVLFAGVVNGRNIWKTNIDERVKFVKEIETKLGGKDFYVGSSCSLLHVPFTLKYEEKLNPEIKSWLSFAVEKLSEISIITALANGKELCEVGAKIYAENKASANSRANSSLIHDKAVQERVSKLTKFEREMSFEERIKVQHKALNYGILPTTTIGSFPQTVELRVLRQNFKKGEINEATYNDGIKKYIDECVKFQEDCGLDVLVHGEPERNDMVEYFGEQIKGYAFSQNGWVQSYGSRCVKPPLLFGDVSRPNPMTVEWISYAQSKTSKIMKGMLTGPVTILNWSFVRDDKPRAQIAKQLALCINDEIADLQDAGIKIIQVDEAAFKEGYPLRAENVGAYEKFSVDCFKLSVSSARPETQIHTHMCYSEFNDIIKTIEAMDADVISIETARSGNELLKIFKAVGYKQEVGPGIYDIHSPRIPSVEEQVEQIKALLEVLPKEQLWINPDCGLKTRKWEEVEPSLKNMVEAVKIARAL